MMFWLWIIAGIIGIFAGALTLAHPVRASKALRDSWTEDMRDRPRANPLRWAYLWWRFVDAKRAPRVAWGLLEIGFGLFFLWGAFLLAR